MTAYYNELDSYAAAWLRNLIENSLASYQVKWHGSIKYLMDLSPETLCCFLITMAQSN